MSFLFGVFLVKELLDFFEKEDISKIGYNFSKIEDFTLYSFGKERYSLKGKSITDFGKKIHIKSPDFEIYSEDGVSYISSREAFYFPKRQHLSLTGEVKVKSDGTVLYTAYLYIMLDKSLAYNDTDNVIVSDNVKLYGKNLIFDIKKKNLILEKVKTEVYGTNG